MKIKTKKGARRLRNQKVRVKGFKQVVSPVTTFVFEEGKVYTVNDVSNSPLGGYNFHVNVPNYASKAYCLSKKCSHLNGEDWILLPIYK